ncbi:hypothetical protein [Xenorhabdus thailandensis]|uniref:hypothetical protein n=1 Tax=Xenorhabdus thailandensis TaxID=3136255 RepID=UPI0030F40541
MQDKKSDVSVSEDSNLVTVTTPEYVKESIKEAIAEHVRVAITQMQHCKIKGLLS